jgi:Helix-turn-helix domain
MTKHAKEMDAMPEVVDRLLLPVEAAELLGVTPSTLSFWRVQRRGPAFIKAGHAVRYRSSDIAAFVARNRRETSDSRLAGPSAA